MVRTTRSHAMTMVEAMTVIVIAGILGTVAVASISAVRGRSEESADMTRLASAQSAGRALAATNSSRFPEDIVSRLPIQGVAVTGDASADSSEISIVWHSATTMTYVMRNGSGCIGLADQIDTNTLTWVSDAVTDAENCSAGVLASKVENLPPGGAADRSAPTAIDFDTGVPAPPTSLTLSSAPAGVTLTWGESPGPGLTAYKIYRGTTLIGEVGATSTTFLDGDAPGGTDVEYLVGATNSLDEASSRVGPVSVLTVPEPPLSLSATADDGGVRVSWGHPGGNVTGYRVFVSDTEVWQGTDSSWLHDSAAVTPFAHSSDFTYQVAAENASGVGPRSAPINYHTVPPAPAGLTTTTPASGAVRLHWDAITDATFYEVHRLDGVDWSLVATVDGSDITFDYPGLVVGQTVTASVRAGNVSGPGPRSAAVDITAIAAPSAAPSAVAATGGDAQVTVSWDQLATPPGYPVSGYRVYRDGVFSCLAAGASATGCTVTGLTNGTTYNFTVAAYNAVGEGPMSSAVAGKPRTVPNAPSVSSVTADWRAVNVTFTPPAFDGGSPTTEYGAVCTSSDGGVERSASGATSPILVESLTAGKTYTCRVRAKNNAGNGQFSPSSAPVVPFDTPGVPSGVSATPGAGQVTVSWTPISASPVTGYRVYRSGVLACQVVGATSSSCLVTGLTSGTSYSFQVAAYYSTHEGALSGAVTAVP